MPHVQTLLGRVMGVSVIDFRCRADVEPLGREEPNPAHSIVFVRRGVFCRAQHRETLVADANHVLFFNAAEPYRYSHPVAGGDDCTILALDDLRARELIARHAPRDADRRDRPFAVGHALSSRRAARLHWEVLARLKSAGGSLALEDAIAELVDEAVANAYRAWPDDGAARGLSAAARRRRVEMVDAVTVTLNQRLEDPPSLTDLAHGVGCSPFHLSRTFHRVAGLSLRRYLQRLRARAAAERLAAGADGLTDLALDLGYADHSHFTNSFRREWGVPPSRFRRSLAAHGRRRARERR